MDDSVLKHQALGLWLQGQKHHLRGDLERAIELYTKSLGLYPTAEAYTFRGWAYSFQGRVGEAIEECKKAIAVDPTFGNGTVSPRRLMPRIAPSARFSTIRRCP